MPESTLRAYADVLLDVGVALQPGQCLQIGAEPAHWDFLTLLTEQAYRRGAKYVRIEAQDPRVARARIDHSDEASLSYVPPYVPTQVETAVEERWARIGFHGSDYPDIFDGADTTRNAAVQKASRQVRKPLMKAALSGRTHWCVAALPTAAWAAKILGGEPSAEAAEELWRVMVPILRLDQDDPSAAWWAQADALGERSNRLTKAGYDAIRFQAPGTDLTVGLIHGSRWCGGALTGEDGRRFVPNLPTEEVFTTPDFRRTSGRAAVTRPVQVLGTQVHGAWFVFEEGRVVDFGAAQGADQLEKFFGMDEQARYLGEVALVDSSSPIFQSGHIFESILYDENAACHIALGRGITTTLAEADRDRSEEELLALGCNTSLLHTDFMIGSDVIDVTGVDAIGGEHAILRAGRFV
ncbi:MAG: aminopeptidase [Planctomycetota bacterium]|jgi:aminopeptidase